MVLARGDEYADALAGVPLAYQLDAPILLTRTNLLTPATKAEILRLGASKVIILGGTGAVSDAVAQELIVMGLTVERISGSGRYDTAAAIARKMAQGGSFNTAYIAVGTDFADALSSSAYAAMSGCPILLVKTNSIPAPTTQAFTELWISKTVVIGGSGVISDTVFNQLPGSQRISGSNRYNTAIALAERFLPAETSRVFIALAQTFPMPLQAECWQPNTIPGSCWCGEIFPHLTRLCKISYSPRILDSPASLAVLVLFLRN